MISARNRQTPRSLALGPLMIDLAGVELTVDERERLKHPLVGGVILFTRNYDCKQQLTELTRTIHQLRSPQLLIAVDQEGGRVQRFKDQFTLLPCAARYGELYDLDQEKAGEAATAGGWIMAAELKAVGIDFSFAPVLDVAYGLSDAIGDRGFHSQPAAVTELARAWITGMACAGMAATGKHFPGHGSVIGDSHECLPCDNRQLQQISSADLVPFASLAPFLGGIMTAHVHYDAVDQTTPTYSQFWLQEILRKRLKFAGAVFSDDLSMRGAAIGTTTDDRAYRALTAGCDMVLICNDSPGVDQTLDRLAFRPRHQSHNRLVAMGDPPPRLCRQLPRMGETDARTTLASLPERMDRST